MARIKVSAPYGEFVQEIDSLLRIDKNNQRRFIPGPRRSSQNSISHQQLVLLTEGVFFSSFRAFESLLEDIFLLYTLEKPTLANRRPRSYLKPRGFDHAFHLIKSAMPYLDWTNPNTVIGRAETYLKDGQPFKIVIASNQVSLNDMKKIRNHIAHKSRESLMQYLTVLKKHYRVIPLQIPRPGEYLIKIVPNSAPPTHYLVYYLENLKQIAKDLTH